MVLARIVTMIGILLGVVAVLIQNQSPTLALVFLGMRSQPLPLGLWIAAAVVIGALLSLGLFAILSATSAPSRKARRRSSAQRSPFKRPAKPKQNGRATLLGIQIGMNPLRRSGILNPLIPSLTMSRTTMTIRLTIPKRMTMTIQPLLGKNGTRPIPIAIAILNLPSRAVSENPSLMRNIA